MSLFTKVIFLFVTGVVCIILGILKFRYVKSWIYEWPKKKLWGIQIWPHGFDRIFPNNKDNFAVFIERLTGILIILFGIVLIILSILTIFGKFWTS